MNTSKVLKVEQKQIGDMAVTVTVFPGLHGLAIKGRLLKLIAPAFSGIIKGLKSKGGFGLKKILESDFNIGAIGDALQSLCENLDDPKVIQLIKDLLGSTRIGDKLIDDDVINIEFAANYMNLYKILMFVVEANRFFGGGNIGSMIASVSIPEVPQK